MSTAQKASAGWQLIDHHHLYRKFAFPDFMTALNFVNRIAEIAEEQGHHPDLALGWGRVEVTTFTHDTDGLTDKDYRLVSAIDDLLPPDFSKPA